MPRIPKRLRSSGLARQVGTPLYVGYRRLTATGVAPRVLVNSVPKAGTHLISSVLDRMDCMKYSGVVMTHESIDPPGVDRFRVLADFNYDRLAKVSGRIAEGTYANGHLYHDNRTVEVLNSLGFRTVFISRDPRDVVVSQANYIHSFAAHPRHAYMMRRFPTLEDKITALIEGFDAENQDDAMPDLLTRLSAFSGWLRTEGVLPVRYEDFLAPGGGAGGSQVKARVRELADFVGRPWTEAQGPNLMMGIGDTRSSTYNRGQVGTWRECLTGAQIESIRRRGDVVEQYGYAW